MKAADRLKNITELCDGYAGADETYAEKYFSTTKDGEVMYPFIYHTTREINGFTEKCILLIPKKSHIIVNDGVKTLK